MEKYIPSTTGRFCQPSPSKSFSHLQINQLRESLKHLREENQNYQKEIRILNQSITEISSDSQKLELAIAERLKEIEKIRRNAQRAESELESIQNSSFKEKSDYEDSEKLYNEKKENKRSVTSLSRRLDIFREMSVNYKISKSKLDKLKEIQKHELLFHRLIKINQDLTSQAQILLNNNSDSSSFSISNSRSPSQFRSQNSSVYTIESPLKRSNYNNVRNDFASPTSTMRKKGNSRIYSGLLTGLGQKLKQNYGVIQTINKNHSLSTSTSPNSHSSLRPSYFNQDNSSLSSPRALNSHVFNCSSLINDDFNFGINDDRYTKTNIDRFIREKERELRMNYDYRDLSILIDRFERFKDENQKRAIARDKRRNAQMKAAGSLNEIDNDTVHADSNESCDENIIEKTEKATFNFSSSPINNASKDTGNNKKRIKFVSSRSNANNNNNNNHNNNNGNINLSSKSNANADPIRMKKPLMKKSPPRIEKDRPTSIIDDRRNVIDNLGSKPPPSSPISPTDLNSEPSDGGNAMANLQQVAESISHSLLDESPSTPTVTVITATESPVGSINEDGTSTTETITPSRLSASSTESPIIKPENSLLSQLDSDDDDGKFQLLVVEEEEEADSGSKSDIHLSDLDNESETITSKDEAVKNNKSEEKINNNNNGENKNDDKISDDKNDKNKDIVKNNSINPNEKKEIDEISNVMLIESVSDDDNDSESNNKDKNEVTNKESNSDNIKTDDKINDIKTKESNDNEKNEIISNENKNDEQKDSIINDSKIEDIKNNEQNDDIINDVKNNNVRNDEQNDNFINDDKSDNIKNGEESDNIVTDVKESKEKNDVRENEAKNDDKIVSAINDHKSNDIHSIEYSSSSGEQPIGGASLRTRRSSSRNEAKNKISPRNDVDVNDDQPIFSPKPPETAQTTSVKSPLIMKALANDSKNSKNYSDDTYSDILNKNIPIDSNKSKNNTTADNDYDEIDKIDDDSENDIYPGYNRQKSNKFAFSREIMKNQLTKRISRASLIANVNDLECQVDKLRSEIQMLEDELELNKFERGIEAEKKRKMQIEREQELERERRKQRQIEIQNMRHTYEKDVQNFYVDMKRDESNFNQFKINRMSKKNNQSQNNSSINSKSNIDILYDNKNEINNDIIDNDYYIDYVKYYRNDNATEFDQKSTETSITKQDIEKIEKIQKLRLLLYNLDQENKDLRKKYEDEKRRSKAALYIEAANKLQISIEAKKQIMRDGTFESVKRQQNLEKLQIRLNDEISKNELIRVQTERIRQKPKPSATGMARAINDLKNASDAIKRKMNSLRKEDEILNSKINEITQICDSDKIEKKKRKINVLKNAFKRRNSEDLSPIVESNEIDHLKKMLENLRKNTIQIKQDESDYESKIRNDLNELYKLSSIVPSHYFQSSGTNLALSTFSSFSSNTNSTNAANNRSNIVFTPPIICQFDQQNYLINTI